MEKGQSLAKLSKLFDLLREKGVTHYKSGTFEVSLTEHLVKKPDANAADISSAPKKSKEQLEEELLYHSGR